MNYYNHYNHNTIVCANVPRCTRGDKEACGHGKRTRKVGFFRRVHALDESFRKVVQVNFTLGGGGSGDGGGRCPEQVGITLGILGNRLVGADVWYVHVRGEIRRGVTSRTLMQRYEG